MSPEQVKGKPVDERSDIYALGIVLYEMLSGHVPFDGDSEFDVLANQVNAPPDLAKLGHVPASLRSAVARALEKSPDARWQSARDFGAALQVTATASASINVAGMPCLALNITEAQNADTRFVMTSDFILDTYRRRMWTRRPSPLLRGDEAHRFAANLSVAGFRDWRLPRAEESEGLYTELFDPPPGWQFSPSQIWLQNHPASAGVARGHACCVRSIRGDLALQMDHLVVGWDTVHDTQTGLTWTRFGTEFDAGDVANAAAAAKVEGRSDWRVPTKAEIATLHVLADAKIRRRPILPMLAFPSPDGVRWQDMLHWRKLETDAVIRKVWVGEWIVCDGVDYVPRTDLALAKTLVLHSDDILCSNNARAFLLCVRGAMRR